jgi:hypothetical protein
MGDATRGSPIPLQAGIKAHTLCEKTPMCSICKDCQSVTVRYHFVEPGLPISPLQGGPAFSIMACVPVLCDDFLMYSARRIVMRRT